MSTIHTPLDVAVVDEDVSRIIGATFSSVDSARSKGVNVRQHTLTSPGRCSKEQ